MKKFLNLSAVAIITLAACTPHTQTRGNYLFAEDVSQIQPITSTKIDVLNLLGTPTAKAEVDDNTWYYGGLKTEKKGFLDEKVISRQTVKVVFDENQFVQSVTNVDGEPLDVPLASRVTPTSGNEVTAIQQILGNIGKFNPPTSGNPAQ
jgi:outer membrane protein assembly factor BamE (lipoprotein component of BamABCDE complex)